MGMTKSFITHTSGMGWSKSGDFEHTHFLNVQLIKLFNPNHDLVMETV